MGLWVAKSNYGLAKPNPAHLLSTTLSSTLKILNVPVAHICNPSYLGAKDQEDCSPRTGWAKSKTLSQKKYPTQKKAGGVSK
jgi:hypothetical protein